MGRIVFNADLFRPSIYRSERDEPESRSNVADMWMTPQGVLTAATLAKMAGGLKLPAGWRDKGVDANAEALKVAAQARQAAKKKIETTEQAARAKRSADTADDPALRMAAKVKPQTLTDMRDETKVRAISQARQLMRDNRFREAEDILSRAGIEGGLRSLREKDSGKRIEATMERVTPAERDRRKSLEQPRDLRRLRRQTETGGLPLSPSGDKPEAWAHADPRGEWDFQKGEWVTTPYSQSKDAEERRRDLAKHQAEYEKKYAGRDPVDEGWKHRFEPVDIKGRPLDGEGAERDPYELAGLTVSLDDLRGEGSDKVKAMSREQLRDLLIHWKEGGREGLMAELSNQQLDQQEVAAYEEMLISQMNRRRSQQAGVRGIDRLMTTEQEQKLTDETIDTFHAEKRREDPYYGMRPEDAVLQIMQDAPMAKSESEQRKLRSFMAKYTPKYQTFSDLFFDNTQERTMGNMANLERLLPDAEKELSDLEKAKQLYQLRQYEGVNEYLKKFPGANALIMDLKKGEASLKKIKAATNKLNAALRGGGNFSAMLKPFRKDLDKNLGKAFGLDSKKALLMGLKSKNKAGAQPLMAQLDRGVDATTALENLKRAGTELDPEVLEALNDYVASAQKHEKIMVAASAELTKAESAAAGGRREEANNHFKRFQSILREAHSADTNEKHTQLGELFRVLGITQGTPDELDRREKRAVESIGQRIGFP